jgi:hypothetical protein
MAQLNVRGQTYVVSKELYEAVIPKMSEFELQDSLADLVELEGAHIQGAVKCSDQDWEEVVELAHKLVFEMKWRPFVSSLGINLEVR